MNKELKMEKIDGKSMDIVDNNIKKLKELFPEVFAEEKINFNHLQQLLGNYVVTDEEHYKFTWHGKNQAIKLAQTQSTGTLRPCNKQSVNWDDTQNLFIEGDNLEVLKILQKSYHNKVKMIYIDPPYNTGNDFVYTDDFKDSITNYLTTTGQLDNAGKKTSTNANTSGRYHTNWLNMMYPRLKLAKNLLRDDGVIFISIDDNEQANLKKLCDEIFGEENYINTFIWNCSTAGGIRPKYASKTHEYALGYSKNTEKLSQFNAPLSLEAISQYNKKDEKGLYREKDFIFKNISTNQNQKYFINCPDGEKVTPKDGYIYRFIKPTFESALSDNLVIFKKSKNSPLINRAGEQARWNIYIKKYLGNAQGAPSTIIPKEMVGMYNNGTKLIQDIFDGSRVFENVKSLEYIKYYINMLTSKQDDIILDFFAGSGTTGHAVMQLNAQDGGNRKFILVQLDEPIQEKQEAYKFCMENNFKPVISSITKERLRRAGNKIKNENPDYKGDLGFKAFKLDASNLKTWDATFENLEKDLLKSINYIKEDRSHQDILYEILLKYGIDLTISITPKTIANKTVYCIGGCALIVCLDNDITMDVINGIIALKTEQQPEIMRVVFKDDSFKNDVVKTNALQTLKHCGIKDIKSL